MQRSRRQVLHSLHLQHGLQAGLPAIVDIRLEILER